MSSESRRGLRIALAFTTAFVVAELLRLDLQLTFLAPLVAGTLASGPAVGAGRLIALPVLAWLLVASAGLALQLLAVQPLVLCLLGLWIFYGGVLVFLDSGKGTPPPLGVVVFSGLAPTLFKKPGIV